ncbi:UNVERIFIED_CONTAM: hypothetical protein K2H54_025696, partial [Gekko kuhli]
MIWAHYQIEYLSPLSLEQEPIIKHLFTSEPSQEAICKLENEKGTFRKKQTGMHLQADM